MLGRFESWLGSWISSWTFSVDNSFGVAIASRFDIEASYYISTTVRLLNNTSISASLERSLPALSVISMCVEVPSPQISKFRRTLNTNSIECIDGPHLSPKSRLLRPFQCNGGRFRRCAGAFGGL
jgi:hypothetical protein